MGIQFFENEKVFKLDTPNTTYMLGIAGGENFIGHIYYGQKLQGIKGALELLRIYEAESWSGACLS